MQLDKDQQLVVDHKNGHALVLAGAGSGKTESTTRRAIQRIIDGVPGERILLLTFTNKAAKEMRERIASYIPEGASLPIATTYHSFGFRFIRKNSEQCNRMPNPSIMDDKDSFSNLYSALVKVLNQDKPAKAYINAISLMRSGGYNWSNPEDRPAMRTSMMSVGLDPREAESMQRVINLASDERERMNLLDFDDLIALPYLALKNNEGLRTRVKEYLIDITVDEAQDNNRAQYLFLEQLAGKTVVMVGDDDQSIYGFRGAEPANLWSFIDDYEPVELRMEKNYRSKPSIVDSATDLVRNNKTRLEKTPYAFAEETADSGVEILKTKRGYEMVSQTADMIEKQIKAGTNPSDIAVLYRIKALGQMIDRELFRRGIKMELRQGISMHDKPEVKLFGSFIRLSVNPQDAMAFDKIAAMLPGIGPKMLNDIHFMSEDLGLPPLTAAIQMTEGKKINPALLQLEKSLNYTFKQGGPESILASMRESLPLDKFFVDLACSRRDIKKRDMDDDRNMKIIDLETSVIIATMTTVQQTINARLESDDDQWAVTMELITEPPIDADIESMVVGSTIHGAKGLEWPQVHVIGMSDGIMPLRNRDGECDNIEEERRLAYVALTRGADNVYIHASKEISLYGESRDLGESIFLQEIQESLHKQSAGKKLSA